MRIILFLVFFLTNVSLIAQIDIKIMDFKILPLDVFIDKDNEYHNFVDLFNANYGIFAKLLMTSANADTILTSKNNIHLIEVGSEKMLFHHWGNDIILFSEMIVKDSSHPATYIKPIKGDTLYLFMYGGFDKVLYDYIRKNVKCDDCNEVILRNPQKMERYIQKKTRLRLFNNEDKTTDIKCSKVCLITEPKKRIYYLSLWKSMIRYQDILNH